MNADTPRARFFARHDWAAFWTGTVVSFLVYFFTCAPSVTLEDCGELAVAGDYMGVPHPPGYPSWTVCAWFFARLLSWVTFRGQPNPAWAIAVMSAFWGALAAGLAAMLVSRSAADLLRWRRRQDEADALCEPDGAAGDRFVSLASWAAGSASALVFAFSPVMWSQSTIVEVYSFNAFFLMLVLLMVYRWMHRPSARLLVLAAFVFGLGLTNYQVLLFMIVPLVLVILMQDVPLFRDFALLGAPAAVLALCMSLGAKPGQPGFEKHVPLSPTGLSAGTSLPAISCNPAEELPVGGTPNAFQGEWIEVRTPVGAPSGGVDPDGRVWGEVVRDAKGNPRLFHGKDRHSYVQPLYYRTHYPATADAGAIVEALRRDVAARTHHEGEELARDVAALVRAGQLDSADSIRARFSTPENGRYRSAERKTFLTAWAAILFSLLFAGAAAFLGRRARRGEALPLPALAVLAGAGLALAVVCFAVLPAAPVSPGADRAPADQVFKWLVPGAGIAAGFAALWVFSLFTPGGPWFAAAASGVVLPVVVFVRKGALLGLTHPLNPCFAVYAGAIAALLALGWLLLENGRLAVLALLAGGLGVAGYALMPVLGDSCPPMNWGYPRTWEGFKHAITRGQYEAIVPSSMFSAQFIRNVAFFFQDVRAQFTMILAPLALLPFAAWKLRLRGAAPAALDGPRAADAAARGRVFDLLAPTAVLAAAIAALAALDRVFGFVDFAGWRWPPDKVLFALVGLVALVGIHVVAVGALMPLFRTAADRGADPSRRLVSGLSGLAIAGACLLLALGFVNAFVEYALEAVFGVVDPALHPEGFALAGDFEAAKSAYHWKDIFLTALVYALWCAGVAWLAIDLWRRGGSAAAGDAGEAGPVLDAARPELASRWLLATVVTFLMMSLVVIAFANPKGDIQDNFIQKVKFISSHGILALWIGYGLALALGWGRRFARRALPGAASALVALAVAAALATPLLPINENYNNFVLADQVSAADQNGHDFGWQFGNYQLRGAPAITEELSEDEEPLPDPTYPRPMTRDAVFFGGTDPGRFVPTYMIYSAMVRPDVYLITQNALADSTYLDTMRGISREGEGVQGVYSDQIWMPTIDDNRIAFQRYTDDVQAGRRPDIGGITRTPDGRVSVNGAIAVMQINGIIAEDIFLHNRDKHDFYVEESYAMDWMYRFITPNGLIMKVNHDPFWEEGRPAVRYPEAVANADMDFWDWYSRRLVADPKFGRDIPARKSFNKLRSALAGTYVQRGDRVRAERAYNQALSLYVYSPETAMRLVQEIYLAQGRTEGPLKVLRQLQTLDPNNTKIPIAEVEKIVNAMRDVRELGPRLALGAGPDAVSADERLRFIESALVVGNANAAVRALAAPDGRSALGAADLVRAALLFARHGQPEVASGCAARVPAPALQGVAEDDLLALYDAHVAARDAGQARSTLAVYLARRRGDWRRWLDFAELSLSSGGDAAARAAVENAFRAGGDEARREFERRPVLPAALPASSSAPAPLAPLAR